MTDDALKGTKVDYPRIPCSNCNSLDWWWRDSNWVCMKCHPPVEGSKEELIARAMTANWKLYKGWFGLDKYKKGTPAYTEAMAHFRDATRRAQDLARDLKSRGITECLYVENGQKLKKCGVYPDLYARELTLENFFCHCCPNDYFWEMELFDTQKKRHPEILEGQDKFLHPEV